MATITANAGAAGNWTSGSAWVGGVAPTAADDVVIGVLTTSLTINSGAVCRSLDCTGFTGTLTHNSGVTLNIGDGTAGAGNVALKFVSGMTYTKGSNTSSAILFKSTSATQQTIATGGKSLGNVEFNAASNGSWILSDNYTSTGSITFTKGTLNTNDKTVSIVSFVWQSGATTSLMLANSAINLSGTINAWVCVNGGQTLDAGTSTITCTGSDGRFSGNGLTYYNVVFQGGGSPGTISGANTFNNLTYTGTNSKTNVLTLSANQTVNGTFTVTGNSKINRVLVTSDVVGTTRTITANAVSCNAADFRDINGAGAASWDMSAASNFSGDCGGNTMKALGSAAFTTAATQTATGTASFTWSTHGWTSRVPLPQDDVVINNAFSAGRTVTLDMPRAGKSINWTGATGTPAWSLSVNSSIFGSLTKISGMTQSGASTITFEGRSPCTITNAGVAWTGPATINMSGGSLTQQDDWVGTTTFTLTAGTYSLNNFNMTCSSFASSNSNLRTLTPGNGILNVTGTGTVFNISTATNLTVTPTTGTIKITNTSSTARTFNGGGKSYGILWSDSGSSTASLTIAGSNIFSEFKDTGTAAHSILFTAGTTTTLGTWTVSGSSGNIIKIDSTTTGTHALVKSGGGVVSSDYLNIQHSIATPSSTWYAGANSINNQAVATAGSGWIFSAPPSGGATFNALLLAGN